MRNLLIALLTGGIVLTLCGSLQAQVPSDPADMMGNIPGTQMSHDEFRARAYAQLAAVALNAHAFYAVEGDFPPTYNDLFNSDAWNLDVTNLFTGRAISAIAFNPGQKDMTTAAPMAIPVAGQTGEPAPEQKAPTGAALRQQFREGFEIDSSQLAAAAQQQTGAGAATRVDPAAIDYHPAGDIYYYAKNGLLQLVMYAPDGTYTEFVSQVPNRNWLDLINIRSNGRSYPGDLYANQVLFYLERLLPRHYNLVRFMGSTEPVAEPALQKKSAAERVKMARELSISIWNPFKKKPVEVSEQPKPGDLVLDKTAPTPLKMALRDGELATFDQLSAGPGSGHPEPGRPQKAPAQPKPKGPKRAPPLGGRSG